LKKELKCLEYYIYEGISYRFALKNEKPDLVIETKDFQGKSIKLQLKALENNI
jgi:hypothetical protein